MKDSQDTWGSAADPRPLLSPDSQTCGDCMLPLVMVGRREVEHPEVPGLMVKEDIYECPGCKQTRSRPGPRT